MTYSSCTFGQIRLNVSSALGTAIDFLFNNFSTQFSSLDTRICKSTEIDCFGLSAIGAGIYTYIYHEELKNQC